jgi:hypothetical protein
MGVKRNVYGALVGKPNGKRPGRNLGVDGRIVLKRILKKGNRIGCHGLDISG